MTLVKNYNIAIVDDDPLILKAFSNYITKKHPNISVKTCTQFKEHCIEGCPDKKCLNIDALLLDYYLSNQTIAPDIIKRIREENQDLLIIVMSSAFVPFNNQLDTKPMKKALNCGANRVVPKDILEVTDTLITHLKIREQKN